MPQDLDAAALQQTLGMPPCPHCGNNRQVWRNQLTGLLTCHRAFCHTELPEPPEQDPNQFHLDLPQ